MAYKRRILFVGEASYLATGFSTYYKELLTRLHATDEYEIAELGAYAFDGDPRNEMVPWTFYPNAPNPQDADGQRVYMSRPTNQFGEWRFDKVCLDFKPDFVIDIRDWWMAEFIERSPLRQNFVFLHMPTVDGSPQRKMWLDTYLRANRIFTYSHWGKRILEKESGGKICVADVIAPGVDTDVFKPVEDKRLHKQRMGLPPDSLIIGMVARNQGRKLFYDLIEAFASWIKGASSGNYTNVANRAFLYLHTSYPDVGYDIGRAIQEFGIGQKVLLTYMCPACHAVYPSFFVGAHAKCRNPKCGKIGAHPPNAGGGVAREALAAVFNLFDLYVQYSICLHPDTPILTELGWRKIGKVKVGEQVYGRDGHLHSVSNTMRNPSRGCRDITVIARPWKITATDDHPFLVVKDRSGLENVKNLQSLEVTYKCASELRHNDLLVQTIPQEERIPAHCLPFLDEDMAYYLGLFVGDGHANKTCGQCTITLHETETYLAQSISKIAKRLGKTMRTYAYPARHAIAYNICDTELRNTMRATCYEGKDKKLPDGCVFWPKNLQRKLCQGLLDSDGYQYTRARTQNSNQVPVNKFTTIYESIAHDLCTILDRLQYQYSVCIEHKKGNRKPQYHFEIRTDGGRSSAGTLYRDGYLILKVSDNTTSPYRGEVSNIEVENDHNYISPCGTTHNCEGDGMPIREAKSCGVPAMCVDYSAMDDHIRSPGGIAINVGRFFYETLQQTEQRRALPDNAHFCAQLTRFFKESSDRRKKLSDKIRKWIIEPVPVPDGRKLPRCSWDRVAAIWSHHLQEYKLKPQTLTWQCPVFRPRQPNLVQPTEMDNDQFVQWAIKDILCEPDLLGSVWHRDLLHTLNCGFRFEGPQPQPFTRDHLARALLDRVNAYNRFEQERYAMVVPSADRGPVCRSI